VRPVRAGTMVSVPVALPIRHSPASSPEWTLMPIDLSTDERGPYPEDAQPKNRSHPRNPQVIPSTDALNAHQWPMTKPATLCGQPLLNRPTGPGSPSALRAPGY